MRLSRPCYDKMHRCPGWAGGGWKYPKGAALCQGGYIQINQDDPFRRFKFQRCNNCDVVIWPYHTRWLDPTWTIRCTIWSVRDFLEDPGYWFWDKKYQLKRIFRRNVSE